MSTPTLVLFETAAGYALFKVLDKGRVKDADSVFQYFQNSDSAASTIKLKAFSKFEDTTQAVAAAAAVCDGKLDKSLKKFLKSTLLKGEEANVKDQLAVAEAKLGGLIREKLGIKCVHDNATEELFRGIRSQLDSLLSGLSASDAKAMKLGLAHSLARYKLKMSPDKVDTMIIQAISLLDELDKELNTYAMRTREWYGWHFPEIGKIVTDNIQFAKVVKKMGVRQNAATTDLSNILEEEVETLVKAAAEVSMGTEIASEDIENIQQLADQVINIAEYRASLYDYLKNRMNAIAPNLTVMVGELVGARLIAHAGSLMNLAKHPASTVQILGAEKALFRALKTKHDTPKYGLIYHASLVGQVGPKLKGKVSRMLAAKTALSTRLDALGDVTDGSEGMLLREKVEARVRDLEGGKSQSLSGNGKGKANQEKYQKPAEVKTYDASADVAMSTEEAKPKKEKKSKRKAEEEPEKEEEETKPKKEKKSKRKAEEEPEPEEPKEKKARKEEKKAKKEKKEKKKSE